ncbi:MAG TPA: hypothetical protein VF797_11825 [Noviherbaspirillum sp.]
MLKLILVAQPAGHLIERLMLLVGNTAQRTQGRALFQRLAMTLQLGGKRFKAGTEARHERCDMWI